MRFSHVCNLIITMNSATNFVVFCLFRRQFRRQLLSLIGRCHCSCWRPGGGVSRGPSTASAAAAVAAVTAGQGRRPPPPPMTSLSTTTIDEPRPQPASRLCSCSSSGGDNGNQDVSSPITAAAPTLDGGPNNDVGTGEGPRCWLIEPPSDCSWHQFDDGAGSPAFGRLDSAAAVVNGTAGLSCI